MTISRRKTVQGGVLAASGAVMGKPLRAWAQLEGSRIPTGGTHPVPSMQDTESPAQNSERMKWFREARFGMFIHWGLYAIPAGRWDGSPVAGIGEWIMNAATIPVAEYKALAPKFNPTKFSAARIVSLAKSAGMKYIVITSKHHDGFAMFDSKADPFNIVQATPFKRDPLKELAAECRSQGIKLGFYHSQDQDWTAPGGAALQHVGATPKIGQHKPPTNHWDPAQDGSFSDYLHRKAIPQIRELLTNYGEAPAIVWFDTPTKDMTPELAGEIVAILNEHPRLIWNNRLGGGYRGDTETPEQYIPPQGFPGRDWESCMTMNDTWGYKQDDTNFKSTETLLRNLIDIASKGGNYLLNIGPMATGEVPLPEVERLQEMGKWLAVNGESVYATQPTLFGAEAGAFSATEKDKNGNPIFVPSWKWRSTTAPDKIYVHLFEWPGATFHLDKLPRAVTGAYLLADKARAPLKVMKQDDGLKVELPHQAPDPIATVLVLTTA
jgi:alpha-L-fucosidase